MVKQKKIKEDSLITPMTAHDQKCKPTPDQMRIAQILDKKVVDSTIKQKLKQIMDATQRSADEVYVALHDSDFDVNQAVDLLIDGDSLAEWCTSEKKKKKLQELKEKKADPVVPETNEEAAKAPRSTSFRGQGSDRRPQRGHGSKFPDRRQRSGNEDSASTRGRGYQGRGRRGPRPGTMVFERSNVQEPCNTEFQPPVVRNRWERPLIHNVDEDWDNEEFTGSLSQTQIFTSSVKQDLKDEVGVEEAKRILKIHSGVNESPNSLQSPLPVTAPVPLTSMVQSQSPQSCRSHEIGYAPVVNSTFMKRDDATQQEIRTPNLDSISNSPSESQPDYLYRLSNYNTKPDLMLTSDEKKPVPTKIPTSAVEMPPEMKSSLSFLDIQFGAMDIGQNASDAGSCESHSNVSSQNASTTTLIPPSSIPSSASMTQLIASNSSSSTSSNNLVKPNGISNPMSANNMIAPNAISSVTGISHVVQPNKAASIGGVSHLVTSSNIPNVANVNHQVNSTVPSGTNLSHIVGSGNMSSGSNHLLGPSSLTSGPPGAQTQGRFMAPSQSYSSNHLPYSFITPPNGAPAHQYEPRAHETNTSIPPPHIAQPPHHPPFKQTPPGVPKGAIVANLPPGSLVGNQYIVGQSNVPYFPHHPIYYYEEVPPTMNNQQRLSHHMSSGYEVGYQTNNPSTRDGVHYNV